MVTYERRRGGARIRGYKGADCGSKGGNACSQHGRHSHNVGGYMKARYAWLVLPVVLLIAFSISGEMLAGHVENVWLSNFVLACNGVGGAIFVMWAVRLIARRHDVQGPTYNQLIGVAPGLLVGFAASVASGLLSLAVSPGLAHESLLQAFRGPALVGNLSPALVEETAMRAGVVHLAAGFCGPGLGLLLGSVPFGALHLFGLLFGNPVTFGQVLGTAVAGLLLSLLYLRFGLWAAVGCHWAWNSLAGFWKRFIGLASTNVFEAAPSTVLVLALLCFALWITWPGRPHRPAVATSARPC